MWRPLPSLGCDRWPGPEPLDRSEELVCRQRPGRHVGDSAAGVEHDRAERLQLERQRDPVVQVENERNGDPEPLKELGRPARRGLPARNSVRADRWFGGQGRKAGCQLVDKPLVRISSNVHSKPCPRGPTFTAEPAWGAIPGAVPGDRTVPQGRRRRTQRRIDDHEQSRWAVRRSTDNRLLRALRCPPPDPRAPSAPSARRGCCRSQERHTAHAVATHGGAQRTSTGKRTVLPGQRYGQCR